MFIGQRIRQLRESKRFSQGEIEKRTGLKRCYISRVEHGHTIPSLETIEKLASAFEIPLYRFFYEGVKPPKISGAIAQSTSNGHFNDNSTDADYITSLLPYLAKMTTSDRNILLSLARRMAKR